MPVSMENLTPKLEADILQRFETGVLKIGDKIPFMHQELMVIADSGSLPPKHEFGEITITQYLIKKLQAKYRQFILSCEQVIECGSIPEEVSILDSYPDYKRNVEQQAVMDCWNKGYVVLKFEWKHNFERHFGEILFATVGKVLIK